MYKRQVEANGDATDLIPLKSLVGAARVVALGEPTHGAHEPLAFRNRLIRFLVEQMGFTAVALETGFTEDVYKRQVEGLDHFRICRDSGPECILETMGFGVVCQHIFIESMLSVLPVIISVIVTL